MAVFNPSDTSGSASELIQSRAKTNTRRSQRLTIAFNDNVSEEYPILQAFLNSLFEEGWRDRSGYYPHYTDVVRRSRSIYLVPPPQLDLVIGLKHISAARDYKVVGFGVRSVQLYSGSPGTWEAWLWFDGSGSGGITIDLIQFLR